MNDFDEVFKGEWSNVVATLMRDLNDLDLAEEATQEAFFKAARHWGPGAWPEKPGAWLVTTARRTAIDHLRRRRTYDTRVPELRRQVAVSKQAQGHGLVDERLALILGCCHPALAPEGQVALTLRIVAGLSTKQIADAFLVSESTMTRRISRAKQKISGAKIVFRVEREQLVSRLGSVSSVIYSIYNEGHRSAAEPSDSHGGLCAEALWLAGLLEELVPDQPEVSGLHALLLLSDARLRGRVANPDVLTVLADQDRSLWDHTKIERGLACLAKAHSGTRLGPFQLQAAISALHSTATSFETTDWPMVIKLYDVLLANYDDAVLALNRAAAIGHCEGAAAGLEAIEGLSPGQLQQLSSYPYFYACKGEFCLSTGDLKEAKSLLQHAIDFSRNETEKAHMVSRLDSI